MTRQHARRSPYRVTRRLAAAHRAHVHAPYPACVLCIVEAAPAR
jgi:hypothetical protein